VPYLSASAVVICYEEALYQVYAPFIYFQEAAQGSFVFTIVLRLATPLYAINMLRAALMHGFG